jgi:hypothetical protein
VSRPTRRKEYPARTLGDDPADVVRKVEARAALMDFLTGDPRVKTAWLTWTQTDASHFLVARVAIGEELRVREGDESALSEVGRALLAGLPKAPSTPWLNVWLGGMALRIALSYFDGHVVDPWVFRLGRPLRSRTERTTKRDARTGRTTIRRDVEWYYRAELKAPIDSIRQIALEYAQSDPEYARADARSLVRAGIQRAKQALEIT